MRNQATRTETLRFHKRQLLRVLAHIHENLDDKLEIDGLASLACLSPFHFHRVFRGMTGEPLMGLVRRLRLERAALALRSGRQPVTDLVFDAGFDSHEAFTRAFKAAFGESPSRFRAGSRRFPFLQAHSGVHYRPGRPPTDFRTVHLRTSNMKVTIETVPPMRVAFARHVGPYNQCGIAWDKINEHLGKEGYFGPGCRFFGVAYDDPASVPAEQLRYDACITVGPDFEPTKDIGVMEIAGGTYARVTHQGSYQLFSETYGWLMGQWLPRNSHRLRDVPCLEEYLNDPENTAPEDLLTDIRVPIDTTAAAQ